MAKVITTELQHSGASAANITLDSSKNVTAENNLTVDGNLAVTGTTNLTGTVTLPAGTTSDTLSFRRLNINGDMTVAQRATSVNLSGNNNSQNAVRVTDRFYLQNRSDANWTYSQESDGPPGFAKSFKALCTSADSSVAANVYEMFSYKWEGRDLQQLKKGTSSAESITVSFWVKSNKTGTYILEAHDLDNSRQISQSYTISSSATWEKKTITFAGDTTGALDNDNAASFQLYWWVAAGSDKSSGTLNTSWGSITQANRAAGQVQLTDTTNNYWQITGIQVEVGTTATEFEHRPYADELLRCKRYCWVYSGEEWATFFLGIVASSTTWEGQAMLPVTMRAKPSVTYSGNFRMWDGTALGTVSATGVASSSSFDSQMWLTATCSGASFTAGNVAMFSASNDASAKITFDAEI